MSANRLAAWLLLSFSISSARGEAPAVEARTDFSVSSARGEAQGGIVVPAKVIHIDRESERNAEVEKRLPWQEESASALSLSLGDFFGGDPFCTCFTIALFIFCLYLIRHFSSKGTIAAARIRRWR
jgi:hypothetical protein